MRYPFEKYLKYLIQFTEFSYAEITMVIEGYGFPAPSKEELTFLKKQMAATKPRPFRKHHQKTLRWIRQEGMWSMYSQDPVVLDAKALLGEVHVRRTIEYLLVANTSVEDTAGYLEAVLGRKVSVATVEAYRHYFCNVDLLTAKQWFDYFKRFGNEAYDLRDTFQLRSSEFALWKLGYRVELDRSDVMKAMFHEGVMRFMETSQLDNGLKTAQTGKIWSEVVFDADDRMQGAQDSVRAILDELREIRIKLGRRDISSLEDLKNDS